jgi:hypothetical protein
MTIHFSTPLRVLGADLDEPTVRAIAREISFSPSLSSLHDGMIAAPPVAF